MASSWAPTGATIIPSSRPERARSLPGIATPTAMASARGDLEHFVRIRYLGQAPVRVHGAATGRSYIFSAAQPLQQVDARDAAAFMRLRVFSTG